MQGEFFGQTRISKSWLFAPPLHGPWALAVSVFAVALPTVIRLGMSPGASCGLDKIIALDVIFCGLLSFGVDRPGA
jgi:hypothetical protein